MKTAQLGFRRLLCLSSIPFLICVAAAAPEKEGLYLEEWSEAVTALYETRLIRWNSAIDEFENELSQLPQTTEFLEAVNRRPALRDQLLNRIVEDLDRSPGELNPSSGYLGILYCKAIGLNPRKLIAYTKADDLKMNRLIAALFADYPAMLEDFLPGVRRLGRGGRSLGLIRSAK